MKKEIAFIASMIILGIALGIGIVAIMAIAVPSYAGLILTHAEKADFELMSQKFSWIAKNPYPLFGILILFIMTTGSLFFVNLNPNFKNTYKEKTARLKSAAVLLLSGGCLLLLLVPVTNILNLFSGFLLPWAQNNIAVFLFFFLGTGLLWFIAGEMGWAGDFSSWKMGVQGKQAMPVASFILGGIIGSAAFGLYYLFNWSFDKYFILVSEVLDKSGETSYLGFKLLANYLMFFLSMSLGIMAGLITAFSPTYKTTRQRVVRLIFPAMLLAVLIPVILSTYQNAVKKYDLGKKNLAEAVGIPEKASVSKTIVMFTLNKAVIQEWPLKIEVNNLMGTNTIELSYENLKKVEGYVAGHKEGSVYNYTAREALTNGYYGLWDVKKGIEQQFKNSGEVIFPRLLLISKLNQLPITQENLSYLRTFTDESKWHIGGKFAIKIAYAFMHFGEVEKAKALVKKAQEKGEDISKITFLNEKILKDGKITGSIKVNGKSPANTKVGLLRYSESFEKIDNITLVLRLLDVRNLDATGRVSFNHLGQGEYVLAIMTNKEGIPYNISQEKFKVINSPGKIKLDPLMPNRNLGNINIVVKK
jgi:hypothetical protein